ncbi:transposase IS204/IS1001/IS1096/IS1165 family protein [Salinisphaera sp. PC39]|uniref:ISL3 family transposase n=1 Tax=Salinisphaera sp. PC39 TaxID=1304156 RepID=UPI003341B705
MAAIIPTSILGLRGQCVKSLSWDQAADELVVRCTRDQRFAPVDHRTGARGTVNRWLRRRVRDLPLWGRAVTLEIEYCQLKVGATDRRMEHLVFVDPGRGYTHRFCRFVCQLCRHMAIDAVARYTGLAWRTVKAMDARTLHAELPALHPQDITGVRYLGIDEVARAKGHDYLTLVYDLEAGHLLWVTEGRSKAGLQAFLDRLMPETAQAIEAVAMDMWPAFENAVAESLPHAAIVYDRFHVMANYSKVIDQVRRAEFKRAKAADKALLTGSRYLLLKNPERLRPRQAQRLDTLLAANTNLLAVYSLKEQLQQLWQAPATSHEMARRLDHWCALAEATRLAPIKRFAAMLRNHRQGICNYANHPITTARLEAGNVAIGLIRKRARGLLDTNYFKLKIRQSALPEPDLGLYALT